MSKTHQNPRKKKIVFVGAFSQPSDGSVGGQLFASRSLVASPLSKAVDWRFVDTSMPSNPPAGRWKRAWKAFQRIIVATWKLAPPSVDGLLVFSSFTPTSLAEKGLICMLGRLMGKRVVWSIRFGPSQPQRLRELHRRFVRRIGRSCHVVMCQSNLAAEMMEQIFEVDPAKIRVIPNWIESEKFVEPPAGHEPRRGQGVPTLIFVGWLHRKKGVTYLLKAMRQLIDRSESCRLMICGSGELSANLEQECHDLGLDPHVDFRGWVLNEDLLAAFHDSDIFVLSSLGEGLPNAMLQAMASGLPVVVTAVDSVPAVIRSEENGLLVEPADPSALAGAIARLLHDPGLRSSLAAAARETVLNHHDISAVWPRVAEALEVAIPSETPPGNAEDGAGEQNPLSPDRALANQQFDALDSAPEATTTKTEPKG